MAACQLTAFVIRGDMESKDQLDLTRMNRAVFEALEPAQLVWLTCRIHTVGDKMSKNVWR